MIAISGTKNYYIKPRIINYSLCYVKVSSPKLILHNIAHLGISLEKEKRCTYKTALVFLEHWPMMKYMQETTGKKHCITLCAS